MKQGTPSTLAKNGQAGLARFGFPDRYDGGSGTFLDLIILLEETGRVLLPSLLSSTALGVCLSLSAGVKSKNLH